MEKRYKNANSSHQLKIGGFPWRKVYEQLKTFTEMKDGEPYYYLETEFMRFHKGIWGKDNAINNYELDEDKDNNKPYTMQYFNSTRTIFGTSRLAILLCIYYRYMKVKAK